MRAQQIQETGILAKTIIKNHKNLPPAQQRAFSGLGARQATLCPEVMLAPFVPKEAKQVTRSYFQFFRAVFLLKFQPSQWTIFFYVTFQRFSFVMAPQRSRAKIDEYLFAQARWGAQVQGAKGSDITVQSQARLAVLWVNQTSHGTRFPTKRVFYKACKVKRICCTVAVCVPSSRCPSNKDLYQTAAGRGAHLLHMHPFEVKRSLALRQRPAHTKPSRTGGF